MNLLFLVEGEQTETIIYKGWLSSLFPDFEYVLKPEDMDGESYRIITGYGYPSMLSDSKLHGISRLRACLLDIKTYKNINHFFICVDSEEESYQSRFDEIQSKLIEFSQEVKLGDNVNTCFHIVIQHCCIETWALGNNSIPESYQDLNKPIFSDLKNYYNVLFHDPELMEGIKKVDDDFLGCKTRSRFHKKYLKEYFKNFKLPLTRRKQAEFISRSDYLDSLVQRCNETQHLSSLQKFIEIVQSVNGNRYGI